MNNNNNNNKRIDEKQQQQRRSLKTRISKSIWIDSYIKNFGAFAISESLKTNHTLSSLNLRALDTDIDAW